MQDHRLHIVTYDICDQKRWRKVFQLMNGYGEWLQLSVFQCVLSPKARAELVAGLEQLIHHGEDHVLLIDVAPYERTSTHVTSLGKPFTPIDRSPTVV